MPRKPLRPCRYPGCSRLVDGYYCEEHAKIVSSKYNRYERPPEMKRRYNGAWPAIRKRFILAHPLCEMCQQHGVIKAAEEVHHIRPLADGGTNDDNNLMALCKECHSRITAREGGRWGRR